MIIVPRRVALGIAVVSLSIGTSAARARAQSTAQPELVVTTDWLATHLADPSLVVVQVDMPSMPDMSGMGSPYADGHIPGARELDYNQLAINVDGIGLELPPVQTLKATFEQLGISSSSHVVLMGPPLMVTRAWYTMHYLGLPNVSALDGGITKWKGEGRPADKTRPTVTRGKIVPNAQPQIVATSAYVLAHIGKPGISFLDTRTVGEYDGSGERHGMPSTGHIAGARRLEWHDLFKNDSDFTLQDQATLAKLYKERVTPGDTVVTYCYIGYRASGSYFVALLLGYPAKLYDGSYDEWAKKQLPTVTTATPLLTP